VFLEDKQSIDRNHYTCEDWWLQMRKTLANTLQGTSTRLYFGVLTVDPASSSLPSFSLRLLVRDSATQRIWNNAGQVGRRRAP
jgi:hypothetical protein